MSSTYLLCFYFILY